LIYLNEHIAEIDPAEALQKVSRQRAEHALRYRHLADRQLSLAVYLLLMEGLEKEYGLTEAPELAFGPSGKPYLTGHPDIHFNLSHCPRAALCVLGDAPVGCDIEATPSVLDRDLCRYCFNDAEQASLQASAHPQRSFTELWTRKEAYLKWTGEGLCEDLPGLFSRSVPHHLFTWTSPDGSYVLSVCSEKRILTDNMP